MFGLTNLAGALAIAALPLAYAQTSSSCDPTKQSKGSGLGKYVHYAYFSLQAVVLQRRA